MALQADYIVDIWGPNRSSKHIYATIIEAGHYTAQIFSDGLEYEVEIFNHYGDDLELLEKILNGRNMSSKTST